MLETLFDTVFREENTPATGFSSISRSQLKARELARKTVVELERKGQAGLTIDEIEIFLRALAALKLPTQ